MTRLQMLRTVIELACNVDARTNEEQRALIALAWAHDKEHNRNTTTNRLRAQPDFALVDLVSLVDETRVLEHGDRQIAKPNGWEDRWVLWRDGR